jgi:hypothetical protein
MILADTTGAVNIVIMPPSSVIPEIVIGISEHAPSSMDIQLSLKGTLHSYIFEQLRSSSPNAVFSI